MNEIPAEWSIPRKPSASHCESHNRATAVALAAPGVPAVDTPGKRALAALAVAGTWDCASTRRLQARTIARGFQVHHRRRRILLEREPLSETAAAAGKSAIPHPIGFAV